MHVVNASVIPGEGLLSDDQVVTGALEVPAELQAERRRTLVFVLRQVEGMSEEVGATLDGSEAVIKTRPSCARATLRCDRYKNAGITEPKRRPFSCDPGCDRVVAVILPRLYDCRTSGSWPFERASAGLAKYVRAHGAQDQASSPAT